MKIGNTILMELKNSWKGYLIFTLVVIIMIGGFIQIYPSVSSAFDEELDGAENIEIEIVEADEFMIVHLFWVEFPHANNYTLLVGKSPQMIVPVDKIEGIRDNEYTYSLPLEDNDNSPEWYFGILAVIDDEEDLSTEFVGMESNVDRISFLEESFGIDYSSIHGFLSVLWSMWWFLLIGLYIVYISLNCVSKDYDEGRMDIILSKPISRRQYLLEKFSLVAIFTFFLLSIAGLITIASVHSLGELSNISASTLFITTLFSWPLFLVIIAVSFLSAVYFENSKKSVGFTFLIVLIQYGINMVGNMTDNLEHVKHYSIISYWNHESMLYGDAINWIDFAVLSVIVFILIFITLRIFENKDIPA